MKSIFLVIIILVNSNLDGQIKAGTSNYQNDFIIFKTALLETHPSPYRFTPKEKFHQELDSIEHLLENGTTDLQFFRMLSKAGSMIRESHFKIKPSDNLMKAVLNERLFPFSVQVWNERLIITKSRSEQYANYIGLEVQAINGKSISSILQIMESSTGLKSGYNNSGLKNKLSYFNNFSLAYHLYVDSTSQFQMEYLDRDNSFKKSSIKGVSGNIDQKIFPKLPDEPKPPFHFQIDEENSIAKLKITTFAYWAVSLTNKDYIRFFKDCFKSINNKQVKTLIIDVRDNRGGVAIIGAELLTYLMNEDFKIYKYVKTKTLDFNYTTKLPFFTQFTFPEYFYLYPKNYYLKTGSVYYLKEKKFDFLKTYKVKKKNHFDGNVYILSNGGSRSATNVFLALVKSYRVGTIVGTESGGVYEDVDGGLWPLKLTLPHSKINVSFPLWSMKINSKNGDKLRGVIPNHLVYKGKLNVLENRDPQLEYTYELIKKNRTKR